MPSRKQVVIDAIAHRPPESVPYHILFLGSLKGRVVRRFGGVDSNRAVGNYINWALPPDAKRTMRRTETPTYFVDAWGVKWAKNPENRGYVIERPLAVPDLARVEPPDPKNPDLTAGLLEACERDKDLFLLAWCGELFERAHFLRGLDALMTDFYDRPAFVDRLLDMALEWTLGVIGRLAPYPVDGIILSDDYGHQRGPLLSPKHFERFFLPRLREVFAAIRRAGKKAFLHSCGDVSAFLPALVEAGLEVLHPVQPEAMDVFAVKRDFGKDLCLYGGVSAQQCMARGTPADVASAVRFAKERLGRGGGYILAPGLDLTSDTPLENVEAFLEEARMRP